MVLLTVLYAFVSCVCREILTLNKHDMDFLPFVTKIKVVNEILYACLSRLIYIPDCKSVLLFSW